jgi:hypothetical protein
MASELDIYGMQGMREIYEAYKHKELVSYGEVALIFDPFSFEPLSELLVNIRHNLKIAVKEECSTKREVCFCCMKPCRSTSQKEYIIR